MTRIELEHCTNAILETAMYELGSVEFKDVSVWTNPSNRTVMISPQGIIMRIKAGQDRAPLHFNPPRLLR